MELTQMLLDVGSDYVYSNVCVLNY